MVSRDPIRRTSSWVLMEWEGSLPEIAPDPGPEGLGLSDVQDLPG